jgi:hypothetical protein
MIAADTSTWVVFLEGGAGEDAQLLDRALEDRQVVMVPVVLTELQATRSSLQLLPKRCQRYLWSRSHLAIGKGQALCERRVSQSAARRVSATR